MSKAHEYEIRGCDVLVVGAGGAGLRAAIEAHDIGARVVLVCKSLLGKAHTVMAEGGIAAAIGNVNPEDNWKVHFADTFRGGQFLSNYRMVEIFAKEASEAVYELERWGALFDRTPEGKILQRAFGAHTYKRLCHIGDRTGLEMIQTLKDQVLTREIATLDDTLVTQLLRADDGSIAGAVAIDMKSGSILVFRAKSVIIASGGCGRLYKITSNSWELTGDGYALACHAGAELMDMEFVQFHPTGMVYPPGIRGVLVTEAVRGEGGILLNSKGERFMSKYDPNRMELAPRDVVARAIHTEVAEGRGSPNGGVYLDISHKDAEYIKRKLPGMYMQFKVFAGIDITKDKMEVAPTAHYMMGGIKVDPDTGQSCVPGLFAAGEAAAGLHGANRLGGNSLSDLLVFGRRAGRAAANYAKAKREPKVNEDDINQEVEKLLAPFERKGGENPFEIREKLRETMQRKVGIVRDKQSLEEALSEIENLTKRAQEVQVKGSRRYNPDWITAIEVQNMLTVARCIATCALFRRESRGAHYRSDYPTKDDVNWKANTVCVLKNGEICLTTSPVPPLPRELSELVKSP